MPKATRRFRWPELPDSALASLRQEVFGITALTTPAFMLLHLVGVSDGAGRLGLPARVLADLCAWIFVPILGVCLIISGLLALRDHALHKLPALCALMLLAVLMLQQIFIAAA